MVPCARTRYLAGQKWRHMFFYGGMPAPDLVAEMACYPLITIQAFHGCPGVADFQLLFYQGVGDGVVMPFHLHMIVEVDHSLFPVRHFIRCCREWFQCRLVPFGKKALSAAGEVFGGVW